LPQKAQDSQKYKPKEKQNKTSENVTLSEAKGLETQKQMLRFPSLRSGQALSMTSFFRCFKYLYI